MSGLNASEVGRLPFKVGEERFETWYQIVGDIHSPDHRPLVTLHGGPGASHWDLLSLTDLATTCNIPVVFYDQLGGGNSTHLKDKPTEFWTPELFMDELSNLLRRLGIENDFDLLGHSWGGMLASQYAATRRPKGLKHLIISDSPASMELWEVATEKLVREMPKEIQDIFKVHEKAGTTDSKEYQAATEVFYAKHLCRLDPLPEEVQTSNRVMSEDPTVYSLMNGPSEFHIVGTLKTWTIIEELHNINAPTLVLNGKYDEAQDVCVQPFFDRIPAVKWLTFENSSHMPLWEERERYMEVVSNFLLNC